MGPLAVESLGLWVKFSVNTCVCWSSPDFFPGCKGVCIGELMIYLALCVCVLACACVHRQCVCGS